MKLSCSKMNLLKKCGFKKYIGLRLTFILIDRDQTHTSYPPNVNNLNRVSDILCPDNLVNHETLTLIYKKVAKWIPNQLFFLIRVKVILWRQGTTTRFFSRPYDRQSFYYSNSDKWHAKTYLSEIILEAFFFVFSILLNSRQTNRQIVWW